jgi:hypothetical protein
MVGMTQKYENYKTHRFTHAFRKESGKFGDICEFLFRLFFFFFFFFATERSLVILGGFIVAEMKA